MNQFKSVFLDYPFSNDTVAMGMQIIGMSFYSSSFSTITANAGSSLMFASFNMSQGYGSDGSYTGYLGNISYYVVSPSNVSVSYWIFGLIGDCPNNLI